MSLLTIDELNSLPSLLPFATGPELAKMHRLLAGESQPPNLIEWAARHLPHRIKTFDPTNTKTFGLSQFQLDTAARLDELVTLRGQKDIDLAPRGYSKTTWRTIAYPLREALEGREPYTLILSDTGKTVKRLFANIKEELENNASLLAAYPNVAGRGVVMNESEIQLKNGCFIEAASTGEAIRGALRKTRPRLILFDDLQNNKVIVSPTLRDRAWEWFERTILPLGEPETNFVGSDTALHREAVSYRLATQGIGWNARIYKALIHPPTNTPLWDEWERILHRQTPDAATLARAFYDNHYDEMNEGDGPGGKACVLWPERFPLYNVMLDFITMGPTAFASEFQNNPINPAFNEFAEDWFDEVARPEFRFDDWPDDLHIRAMFLDPAKGAKNKQGDYAAIVLFGASRNGTEYIEGDLFRSDASNTLDEIIRKIVKHVRDFKPDVLGFEDVLFQSLYGRLLTEALARAGLEVALEPSSDTVDKDVRIKRLTTPLSQRKMRFRRTKGTQILIDQLRDFGHAAEYKDGPDALEGVRRTAWKWLKGRRSADTTGTQYV